MAMKMKEAFLEKGYRMVVDSPTNQQFFYLLNDDLERLKKVATFELWGLKGETETPVRFVTSWATTESAIDQLIANL
jgi:threonine aldolase